MERIVCSYCGLPFRALRAPAGGPVYCCSGCAMAARLDISAGRFPVTSQLVYLLVLGFAIFNQALLFVLALALVNEGRAEAAQTCAAVSGALGLALFAAALAWQWRARLLRRTDLAVFVLAGTFAVADALLLAETAFGAAALAGLAATLSVALWQSRGLVRKRLARIVRRDA